jgi:putative radical SAM enzyme (TIGR03279 family)
VARKGIRLRKVDPGSPARTAGLAPGDEILAINGHPVPDEIALKFYLAEDAVELDVLKAGGGLEHIQADLADGRSLGIEVDDFRTRTCNNACLFCFINQLPPLVRRELKVKDDDYRLSFLHGNYITLTNLPDPELDRIVEQALSPLYVSVHATDPDLRTMILGRKKADDLARKLHKLINGGIRIHAQIVLMPKVNDGDHLARTVFDLYAYYPGVSSVAIVPLGLSDYGAARRLLTPVTPQFSREVVRQVAPWQRQFRRETGRGFAYLADEFYIQGGMPIPEARHYDDFAQIEDGVGMVRCFSDEFAWNLAKRRKPRPRLHGTLATGRLFHPFLRRCADQLNRKWRCNLRAVAVENRFMGKDITVAGLLAGGDFLHALAGRELGDFVIIPDESVSRADGIFVDDRSPEDLARLLAKPVLLSGRTMKDFFSLLCERL